MTFQEFQATRRWDDATDGQLYFDGTLSIQSALNIEGATGEYVLTIGNEITFGDLEPLERKLFDWAVSQDYFS